MRTIKFRGIRHDNGEFVCGDLVRRKGLRAKAIWHIVCNSAYVFIKPDSVAQFVGTDQNGNEVYEGDVLIDDLEQEHIAEIYDRPEVLSNLTLKEQPHD